MLAGIEKRGEQLPSQFMRSIMNDPEAPLVARIMRAHGSITYIERRRRRATSLSESRQDVQKVLGALYRPPLFLRSDEAARSLTRFLEGSSRSTSLRDW
jgi:hypothetical protein